MDSSNRNTTTKNTATATDSSGRAVFPVFVMTTSEASPNGPFTAFVNLDDKQFEQTRYCPKIERGDMPSFPVGSLVVIVTAGICRHVGVITHDLEDDVAPSFGMTASVLLSDVRLNPLQLKPQQGQRPYQYTYAASTKEGKFYGGIRRLSQHEADHLRALIGPFAPDAYLKTHWNEAERGAIQANAQETIRHQAALSALLNQMEPHRA